MEGHENVVKCLPLSLCPAVKVPALDGFVTLALDVPFYCCDDAFYIPTLCGSQSLVVDNCDDFARETEGEGLYLLRVFLVLEAREAKYASHFQTAKSVPWLTCKSSLD